MNASVISGSVAVLGDFVSADVLLPARYSFLPPEEMARNLLTDLSLQANEAACRHPVLVVGEAFGYGTGRESPARALRAAGVKAVVGGPFARMFFRNAINNGVLVIDCPALRAAGLAEGEEIVIDIDAGHIAAKGETFPIAPVPEAVKRIIEAGSLIDYGRMLMAAQNQGGVDAPADGR
ncbi:3-isopropylmalate dehydratase small subunit [Xanthobacter pseudotagetidis]|uniref:hypothetical protein n=1 Tax=Xanthobacter pseudotagetidis TaxID=3119911 RepID=UPI00372C4CE5